MKKLFVTIAALCFFLLMTQPAVAWGIKLQHYDDLGGDFSLTDQHGKKFNLKDHQGKVVLLFFGYLSCPDICPTSLLEMIEVKKQLGLDEKQVSFVYVTVDPDRDSQENLKNYIMNFDPEFYGLYGTKKEIDVVTKLYKVLYKMREQPSAMGYTVDHSAMIYMIDTKGETRFVFPSNAPALDIVTGIRKLIQSRDPGAKPEKSLWQKLFMQ